MSQIYAEGGPASKFYPENRLPTFGKLFIFTKLQRLSGEAFYPVERWKKITVR